MLLQPADTGHAQPGFFNYHNPFGKCDSLIDHPFAKLLLVAELLSLLWQYETLMALRNATAQRVFTYLHYDVDEDTVKSGVHHLPAAV